VIPARQAMEDEDRVADGSAAASATTAKAAESGDGQLQLHQQQQQQQQHGASVVKLPTHIEFIGSLGAYIQSLDADIAADWYEQAMLPMYVPHGGNSN
jgi:hypothetical protein